MTWTPLRKIKLHKRKHIAWLPDNVDNTRRRKLGDGKRRKIFFWVVFSVEIFVSLISRVSCVEFWKYDGNCVHKHSIKCSITMTTHIFKTRLTFKTSSRTFLIVYMPAIRKQSMWLVVERERQDSTERTFRIFFSATEQSSIDCIDVRNLFFAPLDAITSLLPKKRHTTPRENEFLRFYNFFLVLIDNIISSRTRLLERMQNYCKALVLIFIYYLFQIMMLVLISQPV